MANTYLLQVAISGGATWFYTYKNPGGLTGIGGSPDFTQGFTDVELALIDNSVYATLTDAKLLIKTDSTTAPTVTITPVDYGSIQSTDITAVDLHGYAGINSIAVDGVGGKFALSFDKRATWKVASPKNEAGESLVPILTSNTGTGVTVSASSIFSGAYDAFRAFDGTLPSGVGNTWATASGNTSGYLQVDFAEAKAANKYSVANRNENDYNASAPKEWTLKGSNDNWATSTTLDSRQNVTNWTNAETKEFSFSNSIAFKSYRLEIASIAGNSPFVCIGEFKLLKTNTVATWQTITEAQIPTLGMTQATLEALTYGDFAPVFDRTQVDFYCYLTGEEYLTKLTFNLPPNEAPMVRNLLVDTATVHKENVSVSFDLLDAEGDGIQYRVLVNGVEFQTWQTYGTGTISLAIPGENFLVGSNAVKIETKDSRGTNGSQEIVVTKQNAAPFKVSGYLSGNALHFTLGDSDNDPLRYRILLNDEEIMGYTSYVAPPVSALYIIDKSKIKFGVENKVRVEYNDDMGTSGVAYEESFVGDYYGLLFCDMEGKYYSNDLGEVLQKLDFGVLIASQTSIVKEVQVKNKCGFDVKNVLLSCPNVIPLNVQPQMCPVETPFVVNNNMNLGTLLDTEARSFFVRIYAPKNAYHGGDYNITVQADTI